MGCLKLHIESEPILRLAYQKKGIKPSKKVGWYYPFGLKHKGYNNVVSSNVNSVASKFKFNGIELEEALGLNNYEMFFRQYDPAIARWTGIDPVTHFSMSTYTAFDNNPIYWSDPSGADSDDYYGKWDLEWGGYGMDPGDRGYSDEGQNRGYFLADWDEGLRLDEVFVQRDNYFMNEQDRDRYANEDDQEYLEDAMEDGNENNKDQTERDRNKIGLVGIGLGVGSEAMFSKKLGTWMGKDGKIRSGPWTGNGRTGGKFKFAKKLSKYFKVGGWAFGLSGFKSKENERQKGQLSNTEYVADQISNGIGFVPFYGTIWSIGYSLGEDFGPSKWYGDNDNRWFE